MQHMNALNAAEFFTSKCRKLYFMNFASIKTLEKNVKISVRASVFLVAVSCTLRLGGPQLPG